MRGGGRNTTNSRRSIHRVGLEGKYESRGRHDCMRQHDRFFADVRNNRVIRDVVRTASIAAIVAIIAWSETHLPGFEAHGSRRGWGQPILVIDLPGVTMAERDMRRDTHGDPRNQERTERFA